MKQFLKYISIMTFALIMALIGFAVSMYLMVSLELNDRLKYEAAYARGYQKIVQLIEDDETQKAKEAAAFYVDAHLLMLSDYSYLQSTMLSKDIRSNLCEAAKYKIKYGTIIKYDEAVEKILQFSKEIESDC